MGELTPEERQKIYEEEKARIRAEEEARIRAESEARIELTPEERQKIYKEEEAKIVEKEARVKKVERASSWQKSGNTLERQWNFRTGSPHRVFRAIHSVIRDLDYGDIQEDMPLVLEATPISDTSTFKAQISGKKKEEITSGWIIIGAMFILFSIIMFIYLVVTDGGWDLGHAMLVGLLILGIIICAGSTQTRERVLTIWMVGEAYKASAGVMEKSQITDIVADVCLAAKISLSSVIIDDADRKILNEDFIRLQEKVESILPSFLKTGE